MRQCEAVAGVVVKLRQRGHRQRVRVLVANKKPGRPAKPGPRYACGKLKPQVEPISGTLWQRLKQHGKQFGLDQRLTSELGRLNWFGELTLAQTAAGFRIAEIYGRYERLRHLRRSKASPSYEVSYGEAGAAEELLGPVELQALEDRVAAATEKFRALQKELSHRIRPIIEQLCVEDRAVNPMAYDDVREALSALATSWQITTAPRRPPPAQGSRRSHTPLHFNQHEDAGSPPAGDAAKPVRPNLDKIFWMQVAKKLRPDLSDSHISEAFDIMQALKAREIFRRAKERRQGNVIPYDRRG